jgi:hypothetical protein
MWRRRDILWDCCGETAFKNKIGNMLNLRNLCGKKVYTPWATVNYKFFIIVIFCVIKEK